MDTRSLPAIQSRHLRGYPSCGTIRAETAPNGRVTKKLE